MNLPLTVLIINQILNYFSAFTRLGFIVRMFIVLLRIMFIFSFLSLLIFLPVQFILNRFFINYISTDNIF